MAVIDMDMKERFNKAFAYLQGEQIVKGQKDLAEKLGATPGNISKALSGDKNALTNNLMKRFSAAFPGVFNLRWLILGEGEMLLAEKPQKKLKQSETTNSSDSNITKLLEQNKELIDVLKKSLEESQKTNSILLNELSELRKGLTGVPSQKTELVESI